MALFFTFFILGLIMVLSMFIIKERVIDMRVRYFVRTECKSIILPFIVGGISGCIAGILADIVVAHHITFGFISTILEFIGAGILGSIFYVLIICDCC